MMTLKISKYLPEFYNKVNEYTKDEWTSVSDVGRFYNGKMFTIDDYLEVENKYVQIAVSFIDSSKLTKEFWLKNTEKNNLGNYSIYTSSQRQIYKLIKNGVSSKFSVNDFPDIIRLLLREDVWGEVHFSGNDVIIDVGYDYYMYIHTNHIPDGFLELVSQSGLFYIEL